MSLLKQYEKMYFNQSKLVEFIILGFPGSLSLQYVCFLLLLITYLLTLISNCVIIIITWTERRLHTPMYFYLRNLSFLEICYVSVIVPKILTTITSNGRYISFHGCIIQMLFFFFLGSTECCLFGVMAYDRYLAICHPLRYTTLMNTTMCYSLSICSVIGGFLTTFPPILLISQLPFCGSNIINHFFCDSPPILQLSCADTYLIDKMDFLFASLVSLLSFSVTLISYFYIFVKVLHIPANSRRKTFSTCSSHLIVVFIYYSTVIFMYVRPKVSFTFTLNRVVAVFYTVITPILNPIIYCLRNEEVKNSIKKQLNTLKNCYIR
ncbi:PREDICTED: olfactory receptor 6B1-like [Nanorana parkeri]|uniref:olfactory receptor 6B1-like n=1 Tax=Nanorana parkeri TaxID=125878 RepID=UPI00085452D7|nr:PREDICTED: olfactory receptor 6B1-like [Nanorana parkeri]